MDMLTWAPGLRDSLGQVWTRLIAYLPALAGSILLFVFGWILARLLGRWIGRLAARLDRLTPSGSVENGLRRIGVERSAPDLISSVVFWIVFLFFVSAATENLGLPVFATWLSGLSRYLPRFLVAVLILFAGLVAGSLARDAVSTAAGATGARYGDLLGRVAQVMILLVAAVTAIDQLGVDSRFLTAAVMIAFGAVIGGVGLAFGLGARTAVSNIIAAHYLRQSYRVGQTVRVGSVQGRIVEVTSAAVILDAVEGRVLVPARQFSETVSVLVAAGG